MVSEHPELGPLRDPHLWGQGPLALARVAHELFLEHGEIWESDEPIWATLAEQAKLHLPAGSDADAFLSEVHARYEALW